MSTAKRKPRPPSVRMHRTGASWSQKQERVALLLALGNSVRAVSRTTSVGVSTIYDWRDRPAFEAHVSTLRGGMADEVAGLLSSDLRKARDELLKLLDSDDESIRLQAIKTVFDAASRFRRDVEFEARIKAIEALAPHD